MPLDVVTPEIRRYLLGDLDEAGAAALEDRYVADPALLENVRAAEDALIEAFLEGRLPPADRARFEAHYLASPVHRDRVAIARALRRRAAGPSQSSGGGASFLQLDRDGRGAGRWRRSGSSRAAGRRRRSRRPSRRRRERSPRPPNQLRRRRSCRRPSQPRLRPRPRVRAVLALTLSPITTRGGDQATHVRPAGPVDLVLRLEGTPAASDRAYDAELQTVDGRVVWRGRSRAAAAGSGLLTTVRVPADTLPADDYVVVIATPGRDERGRYVLRLRTR